MSAIRMTPAAEPIDIPAIAPALRPVEGLGDREEEGEEEGEGEREEEEVTAVEGEVTGDGNGEEAEV